MTLAKSMLGGSMEDKALPDNGNPGPDAYQLPATYPDYPGPAAYQQNRIHSIPGFILVNPTNAAKRNNADI